MEEKETENSSPQTSPQFKNNQDKDETGYGSDTSDEEKNSKHSSDDEDAPDGAAGGGSGQLDLESIREYLADKLNIGQKDDQRLPQVLPELTLSGVAEYIQAGKAKNVIVMAGAGISTSAGIPDFRTPGTGLYDNLQKYNLPNPTAVFDIRFFLENPQPFYALAKELYPGSFQPTPSHYFIRLLDQQGILLRHYTQNIDTLERVAGISGEKLVEAHGTFNTAHCTKCSKEYSQEWVKELIFRDEVPVCTDCQAYVKPDIVFFGENLPDRFYTCVSSDFKKCDLLIIMGTSLVVQPFASLIDRVPSTCPRLLINNEKAGVASDLAQLLGGGGLLIDSQGNYRDVFWEGDTDSGCKLLAEKLGWSDQLDSLGSGQKAKY